MIKPTIFSIFAISSFSIKLAGPWMPLLTLSALTLLKKTIFFQMDFSTAGVPFKEPKLVKHAHYDRHFGFHFSDFK